MGPLPKWQIQMGTSRWETRSPRIALALLPLFQEAESLQDIPKWPEYFQQCAISQIGADWARDFFLANYKSWPGADALFSRYRMVDFSVDRRLFPKGEFVLVSTEPVERYRTRIHFGQGGPSKNWHSLDQRLKAAEALMANHDWLIEAGPSRTRMISFESPSKDIGWSSSGLRGEPSHSLSFGNSEVIYFGPDEERALVCEPSQAVLETLGINVGESDPRRLIVSPDGSWKSARVPSATKKWH